MARKKKKPLDDFFGSTEARGVKPWTARWSAEIVQTIMDSIPEQKARGLTKTAWATSVRTWLTEEHGAEPKQRPGLVALMKLWEDHTDAPE